MESESAAPSSPSRFDAIDDLLGERGFELGGTGLRVAAGRSGVAVRFGTDPTVHVSWWALCALAFGWLVGRRRR
jgi:hypothetical protein